MPQYLVAIHHPDDYNPSLEDEEMVRNIEALNEKMEATGARFFAGAGTGKRLFVTSADKPGLKLQPQGALQYAG
jgi:hypothetical protein